MSLGPGDTDDVDELVERINLNSPGHKINPKKAAKKARQKLRKQAERQKKLEIAEMEEREDDSYMDEAAEDFRYLTIGHRSSGSCRENKENKERQNVKLTIEPMRGSSKRRSFVIKDFPEGIQDPVQLVEISPGVLQVRRKPGPRCNQGAFPPVPGRLNGKSCFGTVELAVSDSDESDPSDTLPPPPISRIVNKTHKPSVVPDDKQQNSNKKGSGSGGGEINKSDNSKKKRKGGKRIRTVSSQQSKHPDNNNGASKTDSNTHGGMTNQRHVDSSSTSVQSQSRLQQQLNAGGSNHLNWNRLPGESMEEKLKMESNSKPEMVTIKNSQSHGDYNRDSDRVQKTAPSSEKMVTIRRHPTVSDTTVTISVKNQQGEEDILYTLLNGQVVRTNPGTPKQVDIDTFIADATTSTGSECKKASKKKRNKKKNNNTKEQQKQLPQQQPQLQQQPQQQDFEPQYMDKRNNVEIVTCTPVLRPHYHHHDPIVQNGGNKTETVQPLTTTSSFFSELTDDVEIDLTKLKLPPGITITKVNQPQVSSFAVL